MEIWVAAIDFMKAFDTVSHEGIWVSLLQQGVAHGYIELLKRLYSQQAGTVRFDGKRSKKFEIQRGTKQGDPLSTLLFNSLLEHIFQQITTTWSRKKLGLEISLGVTEYLTNLRFADDVLLFGGSKQGMAKMMKDLSEVAASYGLQMHPDKSKILTNILLYALSLQAECCVLAQWT